MGLAFSGEHTLYCSEGNSGRIRVVNPSDESRKLLLDLNRDGYSDSFTGDLAFDPERKLLYALDQANFRLVTIDVSRRLLEETHFPPFRAALAAGARSVMSAYNSVDGVPATQNRMLLGETLKRDWGFTGFVISDAAAL